MADRIERFRAEGSRAAFLSGGDAVGAHLAHDGHPGARAHLSGVRGKIGARHGEIERRQTVRRSWRAAAFLPPCGPWSAGCPAWRIRCLASRRRRSLAGTAGIC